MSRGQAAPPAPPARSLRCRPGERGRRRGSARETFQRPRKAPLSSLPQPDPAPFLLSWEGMYPGGKRGQTWGEPHPYLFHETRKCFGRQVSMDTTPHPHPCPPAPWRPEADSSAPASVGVHREATCLWYLWYGKCHSLRGRFRGGASVEARFSFRPRPTPLARWVRARETGTDRGHGRGGVCARTCVHIHAHTHVSALTCAQRKPLPGRSKQEAHKYPSALCPPTTLLNKCQTVKTKAHLAFMPVIRGVHSS